jgi:hypothetical protein
MIMSKFLDSPSFRVDQKEESKKEYTWETSKDKEIWEHDTFETVEECIQNYLKNYAGESTQEVIFVGECERYTFSVDGGSVIENLEEQAFCECGECANDWEPSSGVSLEDWNELDEQLTKVITDWLKKHDDMPAFYKVVNIIEVPVR